MRAVVQRVLEASVEVDGKVVSSIGNGLLCLIGLSQGDGQEEAEYICRKIVDGRYFTNEETGKRWNLSAKQKDYELLLVSQFTLMHMFKGNKLDFHRAMGPQDAKEFYAAFVKRVSDAHKPEKVKDGIFGAMMKVSLVNDGPVTIVIDSKDK